jgi:integrase
MPKLTKRTVDALKPDRTDRLIFDDEIPRFGIRVMRSGLKSYLIQYRASRHTRRYTFAKHGTVAPDEARAQARQLLAAVDRGEDPSLSRQERRAAPTVAELCDRFLTDYVPQRCKPSTQREYRRSVELFIVPKIGSMKAADVQRRHVAELHHQLRGIPYQANRTLGVLSKLFNLAEIWGMRLDGSNPCRHIEKFKEAKRERFLTASELTRLGQVLSVAETRGTEPPSVIAAFRLLLLTGCRLGEIQTLKWDYVQGSALRLADSKTGAKTVPIGQPVLDVLASLPREPGNPYVIFGKRPGSHLTDLQRPWRRIRARAGLPDVRIHDLRHSFASSAVGLGESLPVIAKLLGHSQVQTTARYAHLAHDPARSAADRISGEIARALGNKEPSGVSTEATRHGSPSLTAEAGEQVFSEDDVTVAAQ